MIGTKLHKFEVTFCEGEIQCVPGGRDFIPDKPRSEWRYNWTLAKKKDDAIDEMISILKSMKDNSHLFKE